MPFLSIITRCFLRPKQLERCIASVRNQTSKDYEQIFINDDSGHGLEWANAQIYEYSSVPCGDFIYILDDDDYIVIDTFIEELKHIVEKHNPKVVICKGKIGDPIYPLERMWECMNPMRGTLGSPNFIVKREQFLQHAKQWVTEKAADYYFINQVFKKLRPEEVYWWNKIVFNATIGSAQPERNRGNKLHVNTTVKPSTGNKGREPIEYAHSFISN